MKFWTLKNSTALQFIDYALDISLPMWEEIHIHIYFALN